jgi:hypothetical protein
MNNMYYFRIFFLFAIIAIGNGCEWGHFHETLPSPEQLIGEWKSHDGEEYIKVHNDFDTVIKNNCQEYHCIVTGKGKRIFVDDLPIPKNPPYFEVTGNFVFVANTKQENMLMINWDAPVNIHRSFGLYEYKGRFSLYTYVGDPDDPNSFLKLYKQP